MPLDTAPSPDPVTSYARSILSGDILASKWVRLACQRHISDLGRDDLVWDVDAALRHLRFFPSVLTILHNGEVVPFELMPFQEFIQGSLFGWKRLNGQRRFRFAYIEMSKGSGKTPQGAGTMIYMAVADGEPRAECYFFASKKDQAMIAFRDAVAMRDQSPQLAARLVKSGAKPVWQLTYANAVTEKDRPWLGSFLKPIASDDAQSGPRPHGALGDELHEHKDSTVVDMMRKGTKNRRNPLIYEITNSGVDRQSICYQHRQQAERMLEGVVPNDALFAYICGLDDGDIPEDADQMEYLLAHEELWVKANPGIGTILPYEYVREQLRDAIGLPSQRNKVLRLNFCVWTDSIDVWIPDEVWMRGMVDGMELEEV